MHLKVKQPEQLQYCAWMGGSIVASLSVDSHIIRKFEYEEEGLSILARKKFQM